MASESFSIDPSILDLISTQADSPPPPPVQPAPVEHVPSPTFSNVSSSHSTNTSKTEASPRIGPTPPRHARHASRPLRGKSGSLSFPVLPTPTEEKDDQFQLRSPIKSTEPASKNLRIIIPTPNDSNFLTALAAQERHVLELKEELQKAERNLSSLKEQWVIQESRRRSNDARKLHQLQPLAPSARATNGRSGSEGALGSMYAEIDRKKATMTQQKPTRRRRVFSPSRHTRALSLVSPNSLQKFGEESEPVRNSHDSGTSRSHPPVMAESPAAMLPTSDFDKQSAMSTIIEARESDVMSRRDSENRANRRSVRASVQMASDIREGLWTFFEDLKHATYGDDARAPQIPAARRSPRPDTHHHASQPTSQTHRKKISDNSSNSNAADRPHKHTVRRQTWQIRPYEIDESMIDISGAFWKDHGLADPSQTSEKPKAVKSLAEQSKTPRKMQVKEYEGQRWETWESPQASLSPTRSNSTASTSRGGASPWTNGSNGPTPKSSNSSIETTPRPSIVVPEHKKRESIPWPDLNKLRPGQLRRTASHLMDECESIVKPPSPLKKVCRDCSVTREATGTLTT